MSVSTFTFHDEAHGGQHGLREIRIVKHGWIVYERRHRPTVTLKIGHHARIFSGGEGDRLSRAIQVCPGRVRPVENGEGWISQDASQALFEFAGCTGPPQLDPEATRRGVSLLGLQLAGEETDGHNVVLLRGV